jgi:hypothetical protein
MDTTIRVLNATMIRSRGIAVNQVYVASSDHHDHVSNLRTVVFTETVPYTRPPSARFLVRMFQ